MADVQVGSVGVVIDIYVVDVNGDPVDMSGATLTNNLFLRNRNDRLLTKTPSLGALGGIDGNLTYTTIAGDLDIDGQWRGEMKVVVGGLSIPTRVSMFNVTPNIVP